MVVLIHICIFHDIIFTAHLPYNHYILVRCRYYIVFTYVDFILCYDFFYIWSWIDNYQFLSHWVVLMYTIISNYIVCFFICVSYICTYLHMYACKYTFLIYLLHMYCIFARYSYDIVVNYICFFLFITNILYCELNYNGDAWYILWVKWYGMVRDVCFSIVRYV